MARNRYMLAISKGPLEKKYFVGDAVASRFVHLIPKGVVRV